MKIQRFNQIFENEFYSKISSVDWHQKYRPDIISISKHDCYKLTQIIYTNNFIDNELLRGFRTLSRDYYGGIYYFRYELSKSYYDGEKRTDAETDIKIDHIEIWKCIDDWYLLSFFGSDESYHYKCDQFDGLIKLMKDKDVI